MHTRMHARAHTHTHVHTHTPCTHTHHVHTHTHTHTHSLTHSLTHKSYKRWKYPFCVKLAVELVDIFSSAYVYLIGNMYSLYIGSCLLLHWTYCQRKWQQRETNSIRSPDCTERASHTWTSPPGPCNGCTASSGQSRPWSSEEDFELGWVYDVYVYRSWLV